MESFGKTLGISSPEVFRGTASHNGLLKKIHDNSYTTGFSKLVKASDSDKVGFGFGVFYNTADKNNVVYNHNNSGAYSPAGILTFQPHIASGYPAKNDEITSYNRAVLAKDGYVEYKKGFTAGYDEDADGQQSYDDISVNMNLFINATDGSPFFSANNTESGFVCFGRVIELSPETQSWVVKLTVFGGVGAPGAPGKDGKDGADGANGEDGIGVPDGGTTGQVLAKKSDADYDFEWVTLE